MRAAPPLSESLGTWAWTESSRGSPIKMREIQCDFKLLFSVDYCSYQAYCYDVKLNWTWSDLSDPPTIFAVKSHTYMSRVSDFPVFLATNIFLSVAKSTDRLGDFSWRTLKKHNNDWISTFIITEPTMLNACFPCYFKCVWKLVGLNLTRSKLHRVKFMYVKSLVAGR